MTEDFNNIKNDVREYIEARIELVRLHTAENISRIFSNTASIAAISYLFFFILLFLSFAAGYFLGTLLNSEELGFLCVAAFYMLILVIFLVFRRRIIEKPVIRAIIKLFFPKISDDEKDR